MRLPILLPAPHALPYHAWRVWAIPLASLLVALAIATPERNSQLFLAFNGWAAGGPAAPWAWLTAMGNTLTALCILLMLVRQRSDVVLAALFAALIATLLSHAAKDLLDIPRPPVVLGDSVNVIGETLRRGAFPSGHTTTAFTLIAVLAAYVRSRALLGGLVVLATLVGLSRMAVGVHWPLDVCGGAFLGWTSGLAGVFITKRVGWRNRPRLLTGIRALLLASALVLLLGHDSGYPQADWLEKLVALTALLGYLAPLLTRGWRGVPVQPGRLPQTANKGSA